MQQGERFFNGGAGVVMDQLMTMANATTGLFHSNPIDSQAGANQVMHAIFVSLPAEAEWNNIAPSIVPMIRAVTAQAHTSAAVMSELKPEAAVYLSGRLYAEWTSILLEAARLLCGTDTDRYNTFFLSLLKSRGVLP